MKLFPLVILLVLSSCSSTGKVSSLPSRSALADNGKLWTSIFQQRAAEYRALCLQAFHTAQDKVTLSLRSPVTKPRAIITDIDETFLDNSPYAVHRALLGQDYSQDSWNEWTAKAMADTLAGACSFFQFAATHHIEIFYVSNRSEAERSGTRQNLQRFGFPFADDQHILLRQESSSKEVRRLAIADRYEVILLLGDNLADFSALFDKKSEEDRSNQVDRLSEEFGRRFIILPNANYGGWEDAIYLNSYKWTMAQKDSLLRAGLKNY